MAKTLLSLWGLPPRKVPAEPVDTPLNTSDASTGTSTREISTDTLCDAPVSGPCASTDLKEEPKNAPEPVELAAPMPEKPKMIVTVSVSPEALSKIKPKVHSFFAKRVSSVTQSSLLSSESSFTASADSPVPKYRLKTKEMLPLWPRHHVIESNLPPKTCGPHAHVNQLKARKRSSRHYTGLARELQVYTLGVSLGRRDESRMIKKPKRLVVSQRGIRALLAERPALKHVHPMVEFLAEKALQPAPFDIGAYETQLWYTKYAPKSPQVFASVQAGLETETWLRTKIAELRRAPAGSLSRIKKRRSQQSEMDDFIVNDENENYDQNTLPPVLILHGKPGVGKTALVYTAAANMDAFVLESNSTQKRSGRSLAEMLDGIGQSRAVHESTTARSTSNCIVLLDEVDVIFDSEGPSFWAAMEKYANSIRRPIVLTCNKLGMLPENMANEINATLIEIKPDALPDLVDIAWHVALCEGHVVDKGDIGKVVVMYNYDLRKTLSHLQFWCQMGLGGRRSALDWYLSSDERELASRVLSVGTFVEVPDHPVFCGSGSAMPSTLDDIAIVAERVSLFDRAPVVRFETAGPADEKLFRDAIPDEYVLEDELATCEAAQEMLKSAYTAPYVGGKRSTMMRLRESMDLWDTSQVLMATELGPYARHMAHWDHMRSLEMAKHAPGGHNPRASRRSWASVGIDARVVVPSWESMLKTGYPASVFIEPHEPAAPEMPGAPPRRSLLVSDEDEPGESSQPFSQRQEAVAPIC